MKQYLCCVILLVLLLGAAWVFHEEVFTKKEPTQGQHVRLTEAKSQTFSLERDTTDGDGASPLPRIDLTFNLNQILQDGTTRGDNLFADREPKPQTFPWAWVVIICGNVIVVLLALWRLRGRR